MATTEHLKNGTGSQATTFSFTFPYIKQADIIVQVYESSAWVTKDVTTHYTFPTATSVQFVTGEVPASGTNNIKIYRNTDTAGLAATFYPGSAIRSSDLNDNFTQNLYVTQEAENDADTAITDSATAITTADAAVVTANAADAIADTAKDTADDAADDVKRWIKDGDGTDTAGDEDDEDFAERPLKPEGVPYAVAQAEAAVTTANTASTVATSAEAAVSSVLPFTVVADKAALLAASVSEDDIYEVTDTTDLEDLGGGSDVIWVNAAGSTSGQDIAALKPNVTWDSGITLKMKKYGTSDSDRKWIFQSYFANDPETKYAPTASPTFTGTVTVDTGGTLVIPNVPNLETAVVANTAKVTNVSTDLSVTADGTSLTVASSDGTNAAIPAATTSEWGAMTDEDKTKLDGVETAADVTDATNVTAAGAGMLSADQTWTGAQRGTITALTDAATIAVDFDSSNNFSVTLGDNRTLGQPTNQTVGQSGSIFITQDGTGSRTLGYHADWKWAAATAPTLTTTAAAVDRIDYIVAAANTIHAVATLAVA